MGWVYLVVAGLLEVVWAFGLKQTQGFTRLGWSALTVSALVASIVLLAQAVRTLPIGTAYAVWVGIGALGTAAVAVAFLREPLTFGRAAFLLMLLVSIVGLKLTTATE
jgi:quaternary ammonium compound-resistance protein SugE